MDRRITNLRITAQQAGTPLDAPANLRHMLQPAVYLCQAAGLPLHYRFSNSSAGPVSRQLDIDLASYDESPQPYIDAAPTLNLLPQYRAAIDQVRKLRSLTPTGGDELSWLKSAAQIHMLAEERGISYTDAARTLVNANPAIAQLASTAINAMHTCGFTERHQMHSAARKQAQLPQLQKPTPLRK